jgi:putative transposase
MKRSKFTEAQIACIPRQGEEGTAVGEICRKAGISEATYYNWRKKYGSNAVGDEATASARGRERQAEEDRS